MYYLTLLKIYKLTNNDLEKKLARRLDKYLFKKDTSKWQLQIHPYDLCNQLNLNTDEQTKMLYIMRVAQEMGMFTFIYEAYCPDRWIPICEVSADLPYYEMTDEDCKYCGAVCHKIENKDFVVSFKLVEKPIYRNWISFLRREKTVNV